MAPATPYLIILAAFVETSAMPQRQHGGLGTPDHQGVSGFGPKSAPQHRDFGPGKEELS
jgi:hypothetical protein